MAFREPSYIEEYLNTHTFEKTFPAVLTKKKDLLAEYAQIRQQGYSESIDEQGVDVIGPGIPLFDHKGKIWGCLAIAFFRADGWERHLAEVREVVFAYKNKIEQYLP